MSRLHWDGIMHLKSGYLLKGICIWLDLFSQVVGLYCLGHHDQAIELGFSVYDSVHYHPKSVFAQLLLHYPDRVPVPNSHRHTRFALCYHSLAMISLIRRGGLEVGQQDRYMNQIKLNQAYIRK